MSNLKIVYDNAADRVDTIIASTTAGSLAASNLLNEFKSDVWRSTSTTASITTTWATSEMISMAAIPFCNLTSSATFRVRLYAETIDTTPIFDSGNILACANTPLGNWDWGNIPLGVNAYSYGGVSYGVIWFTTTTAKKMVLDIIDTTNTSGYIEASRLVTGTYFTPEEDAELNVDWVNDDTSTNSRSAASDLRSELGTQSKGVRFSLSAMTPSDRASVMNIFRGNGRVKPIYVSLFPSDDDPSKEQSYQVYGKIKDSLAVSHNNWNRYGSTIEIEEA